jgi:DNA repair exonuclease SbcCD nuclease subunit
MKLLHAADLHLDTPMRGLVAYEDAPVEDLRFATRRTLGNLVDLAIEEGVDLMLLAGDVFDGDWTHWNTGVHFAAEMGRLREAEIPVCIVKGNHDAASKLTKSVRLPENVRMLAADRVETVMFEELGLAVHGQSYATPAVLDDLSAGYPPPVQDLLNVGLLHTCADGRPGHERYAPCSVAGLAERGYDYWALGHVHSREVLSMDPPIVFPGNPQGRGVREAGPKGATLVELDHGGSPNLAHRVLDHMRWEILSVDVTDCAGGDEAIERVAAALRAGAEGADERLLAARVVIEGLTDAHHSLAASDERLRYDVIAAAADVAGQQVWIERVKLATSAPRELAHGGEDAVGELIRELDALSDQAGLGEMQEVLCPLSDVLPEEVRADFDPSDPGTIASLLGEVRESLPTTLLEKGAS